MEHLLFLLTNRGLHIEFEHKGGTMEEEHLKICPECEAGLEHRKFQFFHGWVCPEGHGTLYPKGELERILESLTGLAEVKLGLWKNRERFSVVRSHLMSPDGPRPLLEIRDTDNAYISVFGDPVTHSLWIHTGEEEKILELIEKVEESETVTAYMHLAAKSAFDLLDDDIPLTESSGRLVISLKLLAERIMKAMPFIAF